jgi:hypothetical protein
MTNLHTDLLRRFSEQPLCVPFFCAFVLLNKETTEAQRTRRSHREKLKLPRKAQVVFLCSLLVLVVACKRTSINQPSAAQTAATQTSEQAHAAGGAAVAAEVKHFKGSIGSTLDLQMKLIKTGDQLTGHYSYQKVGTRINLHGTVDSTGNVLLQEFDPAGKQTGEFKGLWGANKDDGLINIAGNWSKPQTEKGSDKKTAFSLHEEPIFFTGDVEFVDKSIKENNKKLMYEIEAFYPQITGGSNPNFEKFNQLVRSLVTKEVADFRKEMVPKEGEEPRPQGSMGSYINVAYSIALAKDDLASIQFDVGSYYQGAAHPNSFTQVVNYDLKNGKQLRLADLFKAGSKFLQAISAYCIGDLKKQAKTAGPDAMLEDDWVQRGAGPTLKNYQSWTITKKGLGINFDSYQVAPYAAGPQFVMVPYSAIKGHVNPDGPIGEFGK